MHLGDVSGIRNAYLEASHADLLAFVFDQLSPSGAPCRRFFFFDDFPGAALLCYLG